MTRQTYQVNVANSANVSTTIAAISTAQSMSTQSGVGIIRVSGSGALEILKKIFVPAKQVEHYKPRFLYYGTFCDATGQVVDDGLAVYMIAPHSFTGEDTVEFQCHGNPVLLTAILKACFFHGAVHAKAGEFTRRAFMNGKIDLTQAEAVAELIASPSVEGAKLAQAKLSGLLGKKINQLKDILTDVQQNMLFQLDFSEEDTYNSNEFISKVGATIIQIENLLSAYQRALPWREGTLVVLAGKTNAGKSSLFNALLGRYRAIVTERPGTTRDYIEEVLKIENLPIRLVDTAGIRSEHETADPIEREGIRNAQELFRQASLILYVIDADCEDFTEDITLLELLYEVKQEASPLIPIWNKSDIRTFDEYNAKQNLTPRLPIKSVSALTGEGIEELAHEIYSTLIDYTPKENELAPNLRQADALSRALAELQNFIEEANSAIPPDCLSVYLTSAIQILAEITGEIKTEDLVNSIFSKFCIGK